jgi:hypothetical protein
MAFYVFVKYYVRKFLINNLGENIQLSKNTLYSIIYKVWIELWKMLILHKITLQRNKPKC